MPVVVVRHFNLKYLNGLYWLVDVFSNPLLPIQGSSLSRCKTTPSPPQRCGRTHPLSLALQSLHLTFVPVQTVLFPSSRRQVLGLGCLAGIGFTMATFMAHLSFTHPGVLHSAQPAILKGSTGSAVIGCLLIRSSAKFYERDDLESS